MKHVPTPRTNPSLRSLIGPTSMPGGPEFHGRRIDPASPVPTGESMPGEAARQADVAAEAPRGLNRATQPCGDALTGPADVYDTLGGLELFAAWLPQALTQLQRSLTDEHATGRLLIVDGTHVGDSAAILIAIAYEIEQATAAASSLHRALAHAHEHLASAAHAAAEH